MLLLLFYVIVVVTTASNAANAAGNVRRKSMFKSVYSSFFARVRHIVLNSSVVFHIFTFSENKVPY